MELDMTKGRPLSLIIKFIIPVFMGCLFQQLYNTVDTIIVGRFVGTGALAAVGSTGTIMFLILGFVSGLTAGFTVLTAQRFGAGDIKGMKRSVANGAILSVMVAIVLTFFSIVFMKQLLNLMHTPKDIYDQAYTYIVIICAGIICNIIYNMSASVLRAIGDSKTPLYFLLVSVVINCVCDLVFIINFKMGVAGAAYATIFAQGVSGIWCLVYIWRKVPILHPEREDWRLNPADTSKQFGLGIPMALQYSITAIGAIMVQSALNMLGAIAVAAVTAASKVEQILTQFFLAMGTTMATYSAQNMGIGDLKRVREGTRTAAILSYIYAIVAGVCSVLLMPYAIVLFVSGSDIASVTEYAMIYIKIVAPFFIPLSAIFVYRNTLQGQGYAMAPTMAGVVELISRVFVAFLAVKFQSFVGVCAANVVAWIMAGGYLWIVYEILMRKSEKRKLELAAKRLANHNE